MYNAERFIGATIESVRAQTLQDWEHIVVDDGSSDGSAEVVKRYLPLEPRLKLVQQENGGICSARNFGYRHSSPESKYLVFLDHDDILEPDMLKVLSEYLDVHHDVGMVHCKYHLINSEGCKQNIDSFKNKDLRLQPTSLWIRRLNDDEPETPLFCFFGTSSIIMPLCVMLRRSVYEKTPGFDETLRNSAEDFDLFVNMSLHAKVHFLPVCLACYRVHEKQFTSNWERVARGLNEFSLKWSQMQEIDKAYQNMIKDILRLRETWLPAYYGLEAAKLYFVKRQFIKALRFTGGAAKLYIKGIYLRIAKKDVEIRFG